jgi:lysophospholipid hydrolase
MESLNTTILASATRTVREPHLGPLSSAVAAASDVVAANSSSSWLGFFGRVVLWILQFVSLVLYYAIKTVTIWIPSIIYTLFSSHLTVTMSARDM